MWHIGASRAKKSWGWRRPILFCPALTQPWRGFLFQFSARAEGPCKWLLKACCRLGVKNTHAAKIAFCNGWSDGCRGRLAKTDRRLVARHELDFYTAADACGPLESVDMNPPIARLQDRIRRGPAGNRPRPPLSPGHQAPSPQRLAQWMAIDPPQGRTEKRRLPSRDRIKFPGNKANRRVASSRRACHSQLLLESSF
jgi:hypothetical protein